uniref:Uncharacterized protein n=1 Tax=Anguilla anguilla TaxID=7936 RepID=A0A0E9WEX6_ANGAN
MIKNDPFALAHTHMQDIGLSLFSVPSRCEENIKGFIYSLIYSVVPNCTSESF